MASSCEARDHGVLTPIVRTPGSDPAFILRLLDMGVQGSQVPHVGDDPIRRCRDAGAPIPTCCNNTVLRMPAAPEREADKKQMRGAGRRLARSYLAEPPLLCRRKEYGEFDPVSA